MCSFKLTQSQYAHNAVVETLSHRIRFFSEQRSTHICRQLSYYMVTIGIRYDVHRYITTGLLPNKEYSDERPWQDEEEG